MADKINPIRISVPDGKEGKKVYELEFSRDTVNWINNHGFVRDEFFNKMEEMLPLLFYGAFRMHHKNVARSETDRILFEVLKGLKSAALERLLELYNAPRNALVIDDDDEDYAKNCEATVEL